MRRHPFALATLAAFLPLIACLHTADDGEEASADIDDQAKESCNFAFAEVTQPADQKIIRASAKGGVSNGQALLFGDFSGDGNMDFLVATAVNQVTVWQGDGAGHFAAKGVTTIPADAGRTITALATVATGDFDGDKKADAVLMVTSTATPAAGATAATAAPASSGTIVVLYGKGAAAAATDAGTTTAADPFDVVAQSKTNAITASSYELVGDLDGDGIDDFVHVSAKDDDISFGSKDRQLVPSDTHWLTTATRGLAYVTPKSATSPASLLIAGSKKSVSITFDVQRKATIAQGSAPAFGALDSRSGTDLDQDHAPEITILGSGTLAIAPISSKNGKAISFANVPGHLVGAQDLDGNKSTELLFADDDKLMAACGYSSNATALAVVQLAVPYPTNGFVAGQADLDHDGHPDLVTMTNDGVLHAYRNTGRNATAPLLKVLTATGAATTTDDAGTDATTTKGDAATSSADAGGDAATTTTDAGTTTPSSTSATGTSVTEATEPPPQEGSGEAAHPSLPPSVPREDDSTPAVAPTPAPTSADSGCTTAPGQHAPLGFPAVILGALVALSVRRRRSR